MTKPLAVITVTYSPGKYLDAFLDSCRIATTGDIHVICADNGSIDGAPQRAARERDYVELLDTGGNVGYGRAINKAVHSLLEKRRRGEIDPDYFIISNPDVVFDTGSIDHLYECATRWRLEGKKVAAVGPLIRQADGSAYPSARAVPTVRNGIGHALFSTVWPHNPWTRAYKDDQVMNKERTAGWLSGSCMLIHWDTFMKVGGFDERYFMYMEDVDLGDRFGRLGYVNVFCPQATITHVVGHAAGKVPEKMLPAHHDSAYRFQADRHAQWYYFPLRIALWVGLKIRSFIVVKAAQRAARTIPQGAVGKRR